MDKFLSNSFKQGGKKNMDFLEEIFPIEFIESGKTITKNGNISLAYEFTRLPSPEEISEDSYRNLHYIFHSALGVLPPGSFLQKIDVFFPRVFQENYGQEGYFSDRKWRHFFSRPVLSQKSFLFLSFTQKDQSFQPINTFFSLGRKRFSDLLDGLEEKLENAEVLGSQFMTILSQFGDLSFKRLQDQDLISFYYSYFNLDFSSEAYSTLQKSILNAKNACIIGREHLNIISMIGQGPEVSTSYPGKSGIHVPLIHPLLSEIHFPHIVNQCIQVCDTEKELFRLDGLRKLVNSFTRKGDQAVELQEIGLSDLTEAVRRNGGGLVRFHLNVMVYDEEPNEQGRKIEKILGKMTSLHGFKAMLENLDTTNLFFSMVGGNLNENFRWIMMPSQNAACYFHFTGPYRGDKTGLLLCNRNRVPVYIDFWNPELDNKNKIIIGPSGSGKSFVVNTLISQHFSDGEDVIILDIGGSYKGLFQIIPGKYFDYQKTKRLAFNPFLFKRNENGIFEPGADKVNFLITLLIVLWKGDHYSISKTEKSLLSRIIMGYYRRLNACTILDTVAAQKSLPGMNSFYSFIKDLKEGRISDEEILLGLEYLDIQSLLIVLFDFTHLGNYPDLLNSSEQTLLSDSSLICFDLQGIKEDRTLFPIVSLILIEMVLDKFRDHPVQRKHIYMDEAWSMLRDALGDFVMNMFRTIRKSNGAVSIITQGIDEIEKSPFGRAILQNTSTKVILDHGSIPQFYPLLQVSLGLTEHELGLLKSLRKNDMEGWREIFIKFGNKAFVFVLEPSPEEKIAFDSKIESREKLRRYLEKYGYNSELAIDQILEERREDGTIK